MPQAILSRCIITTKFYAFRMLQFMNGFIKFLSNDRTIWFSIIGSLIILFISLILTVIIYYNLPPLLPVFNQLPWGVDRLVGKLGLFIPIITSLVLVGINLLITHYIYSKIPIVTRMLSVTGFLISLLTFIFILRSVLLIL